MSENNKEEINSEYTEIGMSIDYYKTSDYKLSRGTAFKIDYNVYDNEDDYLVSVSEYYLFIDGYAIYLAITDVADYLSPNVYTIGEYMLNSIQISK